MTIAKIYEKEHRFLELYQQLQAADTPVCHLLFLLKGFLELTNVEAPQWNDVEFYQLNPLGTLSGNKLIDWIQRELRGFLFSLGKDELRCVQFEKEREARLPDYRLCRVEIRDLNDRPVGLTELYFCGPLKVYEDQVNQKQDLVHKTSEFALVIRYARLEMMMDGVRERIRQVIRQALDSGVISDTIFGNSASFKETIIMAENVNQVGGDQIIHGKKAGGDMANGNIVHGDVHSDNVGGDLVHGDKVYGNMWKAAKEKGIDESALAAELDALLDKLQQEAKTTEEREALLNASRAKDAARAGDGSKAVQYLKEAGKWFFDVATKIGIGIGLEYLKQKFGY
jgi:hypothetical protein